MRFSLLALTLCVGACGGGTAVDAGVDAGADARRACTTDHDCDDGLACNGTETCAVGVGCVSGAALCRTGQLCSEATRSCTTDCSVVRDADGDGHAAISCGGDDCDDADANRYPGNHEICDVANVDEDCDPTTFGFRDADADSFADARCCNTGSDGTMHCGTDCDDANPAVHPALPEVCNGIDDNCNGMIDEGLPGMWWIDADHDGHGSSAAGAATMTGCMMPAGYAPNMDDCDDTMSGVHPGAGETCNGIDDDCNGTIDDATGGCACTSGTRGCGLAGPCAAGNETCVAGHWSACSIMPTPETCNGIDDDCDGTVDNGFTHIPCYVDVDNDGYTPAGTTPIMTLCRDPSRVGATYMGCPAGYTGTAPSTMSSTDCCATDANAHPGVTTTYTFADTCGSFDYNCDGSATPSETHYNGCSGPGHCVLGWSGMPPCGAVADFYTDCYYDPTAMTCTPTGTDHIPQSCN